MPNQHIMALALALCNVSNGKTVRIPAMTGSQLHLLMMWIRALTSRKGAKVEGLIVLVVVGWVLFKLCKKLAAKLYPPDTMEAWEDYDNSQRKDSWGNYPNADEHVGLFEQIRREQQQRQQAANNAGTFYRLKEWRRLRYQAFRKYGNKCCVCGRGASDGMVMHVDHIKPRSLHPHLALELSNLQIMCNECNVSKSNKDEVKWR